MNSARATGLALSLLGFALQATAHADSFTSTSGPAAIQPLGTAVMDVVVSDPGRIDDIDVTVFIDHDSVSDLQGVLRGPDGTAVLLFRGLHAEGLVATTFDDEPPSSDPSLPLLSTSLPPSQSLAAFDGKPRAGLWQLEVSSVGSTGTGSIQACSLAFDGVTFVGAGVPTHIPEFAWVEFAVQCDATFDVADVEISMDIDHTWCTDVVAALRAPDGTEADVFATAIPGPDNYRTITLDDEAESNIAYASGVAGRGRWTSESGKALGVLRNHPAAGPWTLRLKDGQWGDHGVVHAWWLHLSAKPPVQDACHEASSWSVYGQGTPGPAHAPTLLPVSVVEPGKPLYLFILNPFPASPGWMLCGLAPASKPWKGSTLLVEPAVVVPMFVPSFGQTLVFDGPAPIAPCTQTLYVQLLLPDFYSPGQWALSNGVEYVIGP